MRSEVTQFTQTVSEREELPTNWGRWGERDERGTLMTHSPEVTHFDALAHQVVDGRVYPGLALEEAGGPGGLRHGSTAVFAQSVVTRGVLLDLACDGPLPEGHGVTGAELEAAWARAGVDVRSGDARGARRLGLSGQPRPAPAKDDARRRCLDAPARRGCLRRRHRRRAPAHRPPRARPLHRVALPRLGMPLIDVADPAELAAACAEEGRATFLFPLIRTSAGPTKLWEPNWEPTATASRQRQATDSLH